MQTQKRMQEIAILPPELQKQTLKKEPSANIKTKLLFMLTLMQNYRMDFG